MDIKTERKKRLMTQYDLTNKTGIDQSVISLIETGHKKPTEEQMKLIADVFKKYDEDN